MGVIVDTSPVVDLERSWSSLAIASWDTEEWFISAITASELLHGLYRAKDEAIRQRREAFLDLVLGNVTVIPIELNVARCHAKVGAELAIQGLGIGYGDLWIAATALSLGMPVLTANVREFSRIPGLSVQAWNRF
jgi:tRNA(fMet)-specific endonuclease VapC